MVISISRTDSYYINVFISHSWSYSDHYEKLAEWIFKKSWKANDRSITFHDLSIPEDNPIHNAPTQGELKAAIFNEISKCHVVVIPTGMYATYSKWIQKEIDGANEYRKPILAVDPWGQKKTSSIVQNSASETVGWNDDTVIGGIWKLYSGR